jgi:hypothetical protein
MANYQEQSIPGTMTQFTRCHTITIQNPHEGGISAKNIRFEEEVVKTLPDGEVLKSAPENGGITKEFDPTAVIELRNPETWELTGETVTMGEVYTILASAYWQSALERDSE